MRNMALIERKKNSHRVLVETLKLKRPLDDLSKFGKVIVK
jgi:hypothetical protein